MAVDSPLWSMTSLALGIWPGFQYQEFLYYWECLKSNYWVNIYHQYVSVSIHTLGMLVMLVFLIFHCHHNLYRTASCFCPLEAWSYTIGLTICHKRDIKYIKHIKLQVPRMRNFQWSCWPGFPNESINNTRYCCCSWLPLRCWK